MTDPLSPADPDARLRAALWQVWKWRLVAALALLAWALDYSPGQLVPILAEILGGAG